MWPIEPIDYDYDRPTAGVEGEACAISEVESERPGLPRLQKIVARHAHKVMSKSSHDACLSMLTASALWADCAVE